MLDHSTIGLVVTCDGSFSELSRENYIEAENRTVLEMKKLGKPFVIVLNSSRPYAEDTIVLAKELETSYQVPVLPFNCEQLRKEDIYKIIKEDEPDVVLLDIVMPKLDGLGVLDKVNQDSTIKKMPTFIMVSAIGQDRVTEDAFNLGADYYIMKPFDENIIISTRGSLIHRTKINQNIKEGG